MSNLLIDADALIQMKMNAVDAPHTVNYIVDSAQHIISEGGRLIVRREVDGQVEVIDSAGTTEELTAFMWRHFPNYMKELYPPKG